MSREFDGRRWHRHWDSESNQSLKETEQQMKPNHKLIGRVVVPLLAVLAIGTGVSAKTAPAAAGVSATALSAVTVDNFGKVDDHYDRGAQPDRAEYQELANLGVKTVIDLQADGPAREKGLVEGAGMSF